MGIIKPVRVLEISGDGANNGRMRMTGGEENEGTRRRRGEDGWGGGGVEEEGIGGLGRRRGWREGYEEEEWHNHGATEFL